LPWLFLLPRKEAPGWTLAKPGKEVNRMAIFCGKYDTYTDSNIWPWPPVPPPPPPDPEDPIIKYE
jgi:hypothetical protein